jgi:hypothetical protein
MRTVQNTLSESKETGYGEILGQPLNQNKIIAYTIALHDPIIFVQPQASLCIESQTYVFDSILWPDFDCPYRIAIVSAK